MPAGGSQMQAAGPSSAPAPSSGSQLVSAAASHSRTVFVLRAGSSHASVLAEFKKMQSELGTDNVFLTFDDTAAVWPHSPTIRMTEPRPSNGAPHVLLLNRTECQGMAGNGANWDFMNYWEQPSLALFLRHMASEPFDYVWRWEDDVRCSGTYTGCLQGMDAMPHDLLCALPLANYSPEGEGWGHWDKLTGHLANVPKERRHGCFLPLMRISRRALELTSADLKLSGGFMEVYYPTLFSEHNMSIGALPQEHLGYMRAAPADPADQLRLTQEFHDVIFQKSDGRFYHPIKDFA